MLDPGVLVSALISKNGTPAQLLRLWIEGYFDLTLSPKLLEELKSALLRDKFRPYITVEEVSHFIRWLEETACFVPDPEKTRALTRDPKDDYLICAAKRAGVPILVSGDRDLLEFDDPSPLVLEPSAFLALLKDERG